MYRRLSKSHLLFTFHLNCSYDPWELISNAQMNIYMKEKT